MAHNQIIMGVFLISATCLLFFVFLYSDVLAEKISKKIGISISPSLLFFGVVFSIFTGIVTAGLTGSSLQLLYVSAPFLNNTMDPIAFLPKGMRSDEWSISTPMAIGQLNHVPPFPIINKNIGVDGQNMLIIAGAGVPVMHLSLLAKPATWGFFLFDLKKALAWYWWFPTFGGLLSLWWLFSLLIPGQWRLGFSLSLLFCCSPYTVAWSNIPAYAIFFPNVILCSTVLLLRQKNRLCWVILSTGLGLSLAGFVLLLYPPWQISLFLLYLVLGIGLIIRDHATLSFNTEKIAALLLSISLCVLILWQWWTDSKLAIDAMLNTVYPGRRSMLLGGGMSLSSLLRGFTNISTLYKLDISAINKEEIAYSNYCEIASFNYLLLPVFAASIYKIKNNFKSIYIILPLALFMGYALIFMLYGVSEIVSQVTLWNRVPSERVDLALGLSYILLCGLVIAKVRFNIKPSRKKYLIVYLVSIAWTLIAAIAILNLPAGINVGMTSEIKYVLLLIIFVSSVWLMLGDAKKFMGFSLSINIITTLPFNPVSLAPEKVELVKDIKDFLSENSKKRVLVLQNHIPAMALMSVGIPTINGTMFYPQMSLWRQLGIDNAFEDIINRYQHLIFISSDIKTKNGFQLEKYNREIVLVKVDAVHFNFVLTSADVVAAPKEISSKLMQNPSVRFVLSSEDFTWFKVIK